MTREILGKLKLKRKALDKSFPLVYNKVYYEK